MERKWIDSQRCFLAMLVAIGLFSLNWSSSEAAILSPPAECSPNNNVSPCAIFLTNSTVVTGGRPNSTPQQGLYWRAAGRVSYPSGGAYVTFTNNRSFFKISPLDDYLPSVNSINALEFRIGRFASGNEFNGFQSTNYTFQVITQNFDPATLSWVSSGSGAWSFPSVGLGAGSFTVSPNSYNEDWTTDPDEFNLSSLIPSLRRNSAGAQVSYGLMVRANTATAGGIAFCAGTTGSPCADGGPPYLLVSFTPNQPPPNTTYLSPANGNLDLSWPITFTWTAVTDPDSTAPVKYRFEYRQQGGATWIPTPERTTTSYTLNNTASTPVAGDTSYEWRVIPIDAKNLSATPPHTVWTFQTVTPICNNIQQISLSECKGLAAIFTSLGGTGWVNTPSSDDSEIVWGSTTTPCTSPWRGITCRSTNDSVKIVRLNTRNLSGTIPSAISNLSNLEELYLHTGVIACQTGLNRNTITGSIPESIGQLSLLRKLYLSCVGLSGTLPSSLTQLVNLESLYLDGNSLSGSLPLDIGSMAALQDIVLENNNFTGPIPESITSIPNLLSLKFNSNNFDSTIPSTIGSLSTLQYLQLKDNDLSGSIPSTITNLTALQELDLSLNQLSGPLPANLPNLVNLTSLRLNGNQFDGIVPSNILTMNHLLLVYLRYNRLDYNFEVPNPFFDTRGDAGWYGLQTLPIENLMVTADSIDESYYELDVNFDPIVYQDENGGYRVIVRNLTNLTDTVVCTINDKAFSDCSFQAEEGNHYNIWVITDSIALAGEQKYDVSSLPSSIVDLALPPSNDDFTDSDTIDSLPFTDLTDTTAAGHEAGEALRNCYSNATQTVHYTIDSRTIEDRAGENQDGNLVLLIDTAGSAFDTVLGVFTGEPGDWTEIGCFEQISDNLLPLMSETSGLEFVSGNSQAILILPNDPGPAVDYHLVFGGRGTGGRLAVAVDAIPFTDCSAIQGIPESECLVLMDLLSATSPWTIDDYWGVSNRPCTTWTGIRCEDGFVKHLLLPSNSLSNSLPSNLGNLSHLQIFDASNNHLEGQLPLSIQDWTMIERILVNGNQFEMLDLPSLIDPLDSLLAGESDFNYNIFDEQISSVILDTASPLWLDTQTIAPILTSSVNGNDAVQLIFEPRGYEENGYYEVWQSDSEFGSYIDTGVTAAKTDTTIIVSGLATSQTYWFQLVMHTDAHSNNQQALQSLPSNSIQAITDGSGIFAPDQLLVIANEDDLVNLTWRNNATDSSYNSILERSIDGTSWTTLVTLASSISSYDDTAVSCGTNYHYRLRAQSLSLVNSPYSNTAITLTNLCAPSSPTNPILSQNIVSLAWTDNSSQETGFRLERSNAGANTWQLLANMPSDTGSYNDLAVLCGRSYDYRLRAENGNDADASDWLQWFGINPGNCLVSTPDNLTVQGLSSESLEIHWNAVSDATSYYLEFWDGSSWIPLTTVNTPNTSSVQSELLCGQSYSYRIRAYRNTDGQYSEYSDTASGAPLLCSPTLVNAQALSEASTALSWVNNAPDSDAVEIQRSDDGINWANVTFVSTPNGSYQDELLACNTSYEYRVRARRSSDDNVSAYVSSNTVSTSACQMLAPTNLSLVISSASSIDLSWQDQSIDEDLYHIERSTDGVNWSEVASAPANSTSYTDTGLGCEIIYHYRVRAERSADNQLSAYSNKASAEMYLCPPDNFVALGESSRSIEISWQDNSNSTAVYILEYRALNANVWMVLQTLEPDTSSYLHQGLLCQSSFVYRLRMVRSSDQQYTAYTPDQTATSFACQPLLAPAAPSLYASTTTTASFDIAADTTGEVSSFYLQRSQDGGTTWVQIAVVPRTGGSQSDSTLVCATTYQYRLIAYRAEDNSYSPVSSLTALTTAACPGLISNTVGLYIPNSGQWQFRNTNDSGGADMSFQFGMGGIPIIGDWDGDGIDGIAIYQNGLFMLREIRSSTVAEWSVNFGPMEANWQAIAGDWNGDGVDGLGLYKDGVFILSDSALSPAENYRIYLGSNLGAYIPVAGDWLAQGSDGIGLYANGQWLLVNHALHQQIDQRISFGPNAAGWLPVAGDWNGDGKDTIGLYNNGIWRIRTVDNLEGAEESFTFGSSSAYPIAVYGGGLDPMSSLMAMSLGPISPIEPAFTEEFSLPEVTETPSPVAPEMTPEATESNTES